MRGFVLYISARALKESRFAFAFIQGMEVYSIVCIRKMGFNVILLVGARYTICTYIYFCEFPSSHSHQEKNTHTITS